MLHIVRVVLPMLHDVVAPSVVPCLQCLRWVQLLRALARVPLDPDHKHDMLVSHLVGMW